MPTLNKLECSIELVQFHQRLHEYGISYGDGVVETHVAVPSEGQPFAVHLTSSDFIAEGLAMYVFIDGKYQCNRNRQDLVQRTDFSKPLGRRNLIDFRVRQKEERHSKGTMIAREWTFSKLNVASADKESSLPDHVVNSIGCIEVVVVRCAGSRDGTSSRLRPTSGLDGTAEFTDHHFGLDGQAQESDERKYQHRNRQRPFGHGSTHQPAVRNHARPLEDYRNAAHNALPIGTVPYHHSEAFCHHGYPTPPRPFGTSTTQPGLPVHGAKYESQGELFHERTPDRIPQHESLGVSDYVARITREAYERAENDIRERLERDHHRAAQIPDQHGGQPQTGAWPHAGANISDQHTLHWGPSANQNAMHNTPGLFRDYQGPQRVPDQPCAWGTTHDSSNGANKTSDHWTADKSSTWNTGGLDSWNTGNTRQPGLLDGLHRIGSTHANRVPPAPFFENQIPLIANDLPSSHTGRTDALYNHARSSSRWGSESEHGWRSDEGENTWPDTSSTWARSEHIAIPPLPVPLMNSIRPNEQRDHDSRTLKAKGRVKQDHLNWSESGWISHDDHEKSSSAASGWTNDTIGTLRTPAPPVPQFGAALPERLRQRLGKPLAASPPPYPITPGFARGSPEHGGPRAGSNFAVFDSAANQLSNSNGWVEEADTWGTSRDKEDDNLSQTWETGNAVSKDNTSQQRPTFESSWGDPSRVGVKPNAMPGSWENSDPKEEAKGSNQQQKPASDNWGNSDETGWTQEDNGWITSESKKEDSVWPHYGSNEQPAEMSWGAKETKSLEAKQNEDVVGAWDADDTGNQAWGDGFGADGDDQNTAKKSIDEQGDGWAQTGDSADNKGDGSSGWPNADATNEGNDQKKNESARDGWQNQDESSKQNNDSINSNGWSNDTGNGDNSWDKQASDAGNNDDKPNNWCNDANIQESTQQPDNSWGQSASPAQEDQTWGKDNYTQQETSWENNATSEPKGGGWGNDIAASSNDLWPQNDQSQAKAASWNNDGGADNHSTASTTKSRLRNYHRLRKPAHLQPQPHWNFPPPPPGRLAAIPEDSESVITGVTPRIHKYKEIPLLAVPESKAKEKCLDHQVQEGKGIEYEHCIGRPRYIDTLEKPYAVFRFRYRSQAVLHKLFPDEAPAPGQEPPESASVFQQRINTMSKDELKALLTHNWQKQQGSGDRERVHGWVAEQSKKGSNAPSAVHGSAAGQQKPASNNGASWGNTGWDQAKTAQKTDPKRPSAGKPVTQKAKSKKAASNADRGWGEASWGQDKAPTEEAKSTKAASNSGGWGQDAFASNDNGDSWGNDNGSIKSRSKKAQSQGGWGNDDSGNNGQAGDWGGDMKSKNLTPAPSIKGDWAGGQEATGNVAW